MGDPTNWLLAAWYFGSLPYRWWMNGLSARQGRAPAMVLFYHRVADRDANPWTISTSGFQAHLDWLAAHFELVSLAEAQRRIASGINERPCVTVTFDDGYADNCETAIPLLIQRKIPCTYFVSSQFVLTGQPFPHDLTQGAPLAPNTLDQLRAMAAAGIDIGAHTRTHPDIGKIHDLQQLRDEIVGGRDELEQALGVKVAYFAFPFGQHRNLSSAAFRIAREAGLAGVCSAYGGYNFPGDDPFHLQRIHGDPGWLRLANWLTVDPRKVALVERYTPGNSLSP